MRAPNNKTIIATPLANCWQEGPIVCIDNLNCSRNSDNALVHYKILSESFPNSGCWLKKFPECEAFPMEVREIAAKILQAKCEKLAIIAPPVSVSALTRSYAGAKDKGVEIKFFAEESDARRWLNIKC